MYMSNRYYNLLNPREAKPARQLCYTKQPFSNYLASSCRHVMLDSVDGLLRQSTGGSYLVWLTDAMALNNVFVAQLASASVSY